MTRSFIALLIALSAALAAQKPAHPPKIWRDAAMADWTTPLATLNVRPGLHDGSLASLEELFDPSRLLPDYEPRGWKGPGVWILSSSLCRSP